MLILGQAHARGRIARGERDHARAVVQARAIVRIEQLAERDHGDVGPLMHQQLAVGGAVDQIVVGDEHDRIGRQRLQEVLGAALHGR